MERQLLPQDKEEQILEFSKPYISRENSSGIDDQEIN